MDRFSEILYDFGQELGQTLYVDENQVCQLVYEDELTLQLHFDPAGEQVTIGAYLCEVPPGKYREKLFTAALKHNGRLKKGGILSYSERNNKLTYVRSIAAQKLTGPALNEAINAFISVSLQWKYAVEKGGPLPTTEPPPTSGGRLFGL